MKVFSPLENLSRMNPSIKAEPPDKNELLGLKRSGLARFEDA